jgi:alpha-tubulin suppressor-like RCC1 family protein
MQCLRRSRRLGSAALTLGLLGAGMLAAPAAAQASQAARGPAALHEGAAWGDNSFGQLGNGGGLGSSTPVGVSQLTSLQQISAGNTHTLAVTTTGAVYAWGYNGSGELGTGNTLNEPSPQLVQGVGGITQVAAGWDHSLALRSDGTVWAWGNNTAGQLGDGNAVQSSTPVEVTGLTGVVQIAAGNEWSMALKSDGTVWGWGGNQWGQLGVAAPTAIATPQQIPGLARVTSIAAGTFFGMAVQSRSLYTTFNQVLAWGQDVYGTTGNGTACLCGYIKPAVVPGVNVPDVEAIAAGSEFAMVLGTDGSVWEWGDNSDGQVGDGTTLTRESPVEAIGQGSGITQIAAGANHALAVLSNDTVEGWGANQDGQLGGNFASACSLTPVAVAGLTNVSQVTAGGNASLAVHAVFQFGRF